MENARVEAENEESNEPPPWELLPNEMGTVGSFTENAQIDTQLRAMIATAEEEVRSLRPSSSVYSESTASIYSSLSRHSRRMSLIVDELPMVEVKMASERRKSNALSVRKSWISGPDTLTMVPEAYRQLSAPRSQTEPHRPEVKSSAELEGELSEDPEKAFKDLRKFLSCML